MLGGRTVSQSPNVPLMSGSTQILTPRMHGLLQRIQRAQRTPLHAQTPAQARNSYEAAA
mgnify:CR=1 FL=1